MEISGIVPQAAQLSKLGDHTVPHITSEPPEHLTAGDRIKQASQDHASDASQHLPEPGTAGAELPETANAAKHAQLAMMGRANPRLAAMYMLSHRAAPAA